MFENVTWFAFASTLTVVGVLATWLLWRRRGAGAGLRALSFTLLPFAAYLTGTLKLVSRIANAVGDWGVHFVFSPSAWLGIVMAGLAGVVYVVSGLVRHRTPPAAGTGGKPTRAVTPRSRPTASPVDDDMADIEAILKKHGIS